MFAPDSEESDWKLKLRYGRLKTPYSHFSMVAEGVTTSEANDFDCPKGPAFIGMKAWASSTEEAGDMVAVIGRQLAFEVTGRTYIYETEPGQPPGENPRAYDIKFTPFQDAEKPA